MAKMTLEELRKLRESTQQQIKKRDTEGKQAQIIVGMGTCGIAAGAKDTLDAFISELDSHGMGGDVLIRQTGCMGLCQNEPTVEVVMKDMPTVIYGRVDPATAKEIVEKHLMKKELLNDRILDRPSGDILKN
ncbi:(2Fe-2S) ferredoxin domain-containing protein [Brucepastera parasyntrophica]|uniref:(2Fe-2S) ferredoxin domain-containing protein n=1 Tax=Brucepastera parasyntrophica TaxID=2880008 RepID=UPI00210CB3E8|nr:(2Fe-2S) ferredoxin domain-containing protein [Brucepastera parasyntrophica]ULQ58949.1 (2Fe-2S) ferredoxin domain-containing protein [Brucepastera parasyntrophica]